MLKTTLGGDPFSSLMVMHHPILTPTESATCWSALPATVDQTQLLCDQIVYTIHLKFFINVVSQQKTNAALRPAALV